MISLIVILIILACVVLAFFVLVQAPKGGGLTGNFGSISTQVMGVKQSSDIMEKGTWTAMGVIAVLCIVSVMFLSKVQNTDDGSGRKQKGKASTSAPAAQQPAAKGGRK